MLPIYERYRPKELSAVVGQHKAVDAAQRVLSAGLGGQAVWISGPSGTGKTTIARILAASIAEPWFVTEYDSADQVRQAEIEDIDEFMGLYGFGLGGRVWIVNEAHGLRAPIVRQLLGLLERLPDHCAIIFTTTREGQAKLFDDGIDAEPLLSRCVPIELTAYGTAQPFAAELKRIAAVEGMDGMPAASYVRLIRDCHNNLRAALQRLPLCKE